MLLLLPELSLKNIALLTIAVWSFCWFYCFAFYVIEHYVDPGFRFFDLWDFVRYMIRQDSRPREISAR